MDIQQLSTSNQVFLYVAVAIYLIIIGGLGLLGWRRTRTVEDYLVGGRKVHPYVMAMSYGATFISTSAIVGFGGVAAIYGMGMMWLTFLNIFFGILIAFILFGGRTRSLGLQLDAHTFPELLGRRYRSRFIQASAASVIFIFMPLYAAAVLMGAAKFLAQQMHLTYETALILFSLLVAIYVIMGGLKGVLYTDAFQGTIMLFGMAILLVLTYHQLGGVTTAHQQLARLAPLVPAGLQAEGHRGWTLFPAAFSVLWWKMVGTIMAGVAIGVLAQPQLAVRFMTVKNTRELARAVPTGCLFILVCVGAAYAIGPLTNVYFHQSSGQIAIQAAKGDVERILPLYITSALPPWFSILFMLTMLSAAMSTLSGQFHTVGAALGRDLMEQTFGMHRERGGLLATRTGMVIGILTSVWLGFQLEKTFGQTGTEIVARGTAVFFGLCASAFLPMYAGALWSRRITRAGAIAGMLTGAFTSLTWMLFVQEKSSTALKLCQHWFGTRSLAIRVTDGVEHFSQSGPIIWAYVDATLVSLPLAILLTLAVSLFTPPMPNDHLDRCFAFNPQHRPTA